MSAIKGQFGYLHVDAWRLIWMGKPTAEYDDGLQST